MSVSMMPPPLRMNAELHTDARELFLSLFDSVPI